MLKIQMHDLTDKKTKNHALSLSLSFTHAHACEFYMHACTYTHTHTHTHTHTQKERELNYTYLQFQTPTHTLTPLPPPPPPHSVPQFHTPLHPSTTPPLHSYTTADLRGTDPPACTGPVSCMRLWQGQRSSSGTVGSAQPGSSRNSAPCCSQTAHHINKRCYMLYHLPYAITHTAAGMWVFKDS